MALLWDLRFVVVMILAFWLGGSLLVEAWRRYPRYVQGAAALIILVVLVQAWLVRRRNEKRGWRVMCGSPRGWFYQEMRDGVWEGILFKELGDYRETPHILDVGTPARWSQHPAWLRERREEILARVKAELKRPGFVLREND